MQYIVKVKQKKPVLIMVYFHCEIIASASDAQYANGNLASSSISLNKLHQFKITACHSSGRGLIYSMILSSIEPQPLQ